jgi:hypothetical protein
MSSGTSTSAVATGLVEICIGTTLCLKDVS